MDKNKIIRQIIEDSGKTPYRIYKDSGVAQSTISEWANDVREPNTTIVDIVYHASKNDEDFLKNIKKFLKKS